MNNDTMAAMAVIVVDAITIMTTSAAAAGDSTVTPTVDGGDGSDEYLFYF